MPICIRCREDKNMVNSAYKGFIICMDCAREERALAEADLVATLTPEQKELFDRYKQKRDVFSSMIILD